ncbi:Polyamine aminopropyltransferase [archaeon HR06]|nr:Polyamine aminopropyltransferase [archaeon HR06]
MTKKNYLLKLQVFLSGAVVMILEIVGSRFLAPIFGNTIYVWGSLIGVVLSALALGYFYGGKVADLKPNKRLFSTIIFTAGLLILTIPYFSPNILEFVLLFEFDYRLGPLISTIILLFPSTFLLGMVSPFAVKLLTLELENLGKVAGNLYSLSTVGSIVGTFLTVFILIPSFDIRSIILGSGLTLMFISVFNLSKQSKIIFFIILIFLITPLTQFVVGLYANIGEILYQKDTFYNSLAVVQNGDLRILYLNGLPHSAMDIREPFKLVFKYTRFFELGLLLNEEAKRVLFIGGGGFSGPKYFLKNYQDLLIDVVEIDREVISVAKRFFYLDENPRLKIFEDDGRRYLQKNNEDKYDVIILDAYSKTYIPFHLMTLEFFQLIYDRLNNNGVVVSNIIASFVGDSSEMLWAQYKTISTIFPKIYLFRASENEGLAVQNIILVACKSECSFDDYNETVIFALQNLWTNIPYLEEFPIIKDNYAPVERLISPITGKPYSIELEGYNYSFPSLLYSGSNLLTLSILLILLIIWFLTLPNSIKSI